MTPGAARTAVAAALATTMAVALLVPTAEASVAAGTDCYDSALPTTVEERRLETSHRPDQAPASQQILLRTGLNADVRAFAEDLCAVADAAQARAVIRTHGTALWSAAVGRAQSVPPAGELPASDDRGLYWARISMTRLIHQWAPEGGVTPEQRAALLRPFERTSRGITTSQFSAEPGVVKLLVTGFDPFTLDSDIRIGNPSGATALTLDGQRLEVDGQPVEVQTMVFPVRYADFDERMVERALSPHYRSGDQRADMVVTVSQGRYGQFDLEVFNGRRRSVSSIGDNNNVQGGGTYSKPVVAPGMPPGPEFLQSSLPIDAMSAADADPFRLLVNRSVVEIPAGGSNPVLRPDGPTAGSTAVEGSPGGYLSNEIAYRNTLLRERLFAAMPAGHLHEPVLEFGQRTAITDPTYEANRDAIIAAAVRIIQAGVAALD